MTRALPLGHIVACNFVDLALNVMLVSGSFQALMGQLRPRLDVGATAAAGILVALPPLPCNIVLLWHG